MRVLIFDTETTGLPKNQKEQPSVTNIQDWPYIVQISWIYYDTDTCQLINESDNIIKLLPGIEISEESTNIHKITNEMCKLKGKKITDILENFMELFMKADLCVAHNMSFDHKIINAEMLRSVMNPEINKGDWERKLILWQTFANSNKLFCTMQETIDMCNIKAISLRTGREYVKFPTLAELYEYYFGYKPKDLHNAFVDVMICARCFHMLRFGNDICENNIKFRRFVNKTR